MSVGTLFGHMPMHTGEGNDIFETLQFSYDKSSMRY